MMLLGAAVLFSVVAFSAGQSCDQGNCIDTPVCATADDRLCQNCLPGWFGRGCDHHCGESLYKDAVVKTNPLVYYRFNGFESGNAIACAYQRNDSIQCQLSYNPAGTTLNATGPRPAQGFNGLEVRNEAVYCSGTKDTGLFDITQPRGIMSTKLGSVCLMFAVNPLDKDKKGMLYYFLGCEESQKQSCDSGDGFGDQLEFHMHANTDGTIGMFAEGAKTGPDMQITTTQKYDSGNWYHACGTWNRDQGRVTLYINGGSSANGGETVSASGYQAAVFESSARHQLCFPTSYPSNTAQQRHYDGSLDEVALYDSELDAATVLTLYNAAVKGGSDAVKLTCSSGQETCDKDSGLGYKCFPCDVGMGGAQCDRNCGQVANNCNGIVQCDENMEVVACPTGCTPGWWDSDCESQCSLDSYPSEVADSHPLAYWRFNSAQASVLTINNLILSNSPKAISAASLSSTGGVLRGGDVWGPKTGLIARSGWPGFTDENKWAILDGSAQGVISTLTSPENTMTSATGSVCLFARANPADEDMEGMLWYCGTSTNSAGYGGNNEMHVSFGGPISSTLNVRFQSRSGRGAENVCPGGSASVPCCIDNYGDQINLWTCEDNNVNQIYDLVRVGNTDSNIYSIQGHRDNLCLNATYKSGQGPTPMINPVPCNTNDQHQLWEKLPTDQLRNVGYGECIDVYGMQQLGLWGCENGNSNQQWQFNGFVEAGHIGYFMQKNSIGTRAQQWSTANYNDGKWHHICMTWTTSRISLYVDNNKITGTVPAGTDFSCTGRQRAGKAPGGRSFDGAIDELSIYNYELPDLTVSKLYSSAAAPASKLACPVNAGRLVCDLDGSDAVCACISPGVKGDDCKTPCTDPYNRCDSSVLTCDTKGNALSCASCPQGKKGALCDQLCDDGFWGDGCSQTCNATFCVPHTSSNGADVTCDNANGGGVQCTACLPGYYGTGCQNACPVGNCGAGQIFCDKPTGMFKTCESCAAGWWSTDCNSPCSTNCLICDQILGTCQACRAGYSGMGCANCDQSYTRSGDGSCVLCNCNGHSLECDPDDGTCLNCADLTGGAHCESCVRGSNRTSPTDPCVDINECAPGQPAAAQCTTCDNTAPGLLCSGLPVNLEVVQTLLIRGLSAADIYARYNRMSNNNAFKSATVAQQIDALQNMPNPNGGSSSQSNSSDSSVPAWGIVLIVIAAIVAILLVVVLISHHRNGSKGSYRVSNANKSNAGTASSAEPASSPESAANPVFDDEAPDEDY